LLGADEKPSINMRDVNGNNNSIGSNIYNKEISPEINDDTRELVQMIQDLSLVQRSQIVVMIDKMRKGE
jgi:hypothetical protein